MINSGTIQLTSGMSTFGSAVNYGTITLARGASLSNSEGTFTNNGTITVPCGASVSGPITGNQPQYAGGCPPPSFTDVWRINTTKANVGGNSIAHWNTATWTWTTVDGGATKVAVAPTGQPWIVNKQGAVYNRTKGPSGAYVDGKWQGVPGAFSDIAVGADGSVWGIGILNAAVGGNHIYHYNPRAATSWDTVDGAAIDVAVGPTGQPWVVNKQGAVYNRTKGPSGTYVDGKWQGVPGTLTDIAVGGDGSVWGVGVLNVARPPDQPYFGGKRIYHYNPKVASSWDLVDGGQAGAVEIAAGGNGQPYILDSEGTVWNLTPGTNGYVNPAFDFLGSNWGASASIGVGGTP